MLWQVAKTFCCLIILFCTGCASVPSPPQVRIPSFLQKKKSSVFEEKKEDWKAETEDDTPKRQPLIASGRGHKASPHDAATQRLIEEELADATLAERHEWNDFLATIDSSMVPYVLKSRHAKQSQERQFVSPENEKHVSDSEFIATIEDGHSGLPPQSEVQQALGQINSTHERGIKLTSREASVATNEVSLPHSQNNKSSEDRDWSGRLKSLTEWEKNPLNFSRDEQTETQQQRQRHLPKIISYPFQKTEADSGRKPLNPTNPEEIAKHNLQERKGASPDSLRISPGAKLWEEELNKLVSMMEAEASASGIANEGNLSRDELRKQVALRMLYLINDQTELAMQPISGLQSADQEFWISLFWGLSSYLNEKGTAPAERSTKTIQQLRSATHYLQLASKLQIQNASFCSKINGFGSYEEFLVDEFSPGQPVLIYCDIRNFQSEPSEDGFYVTKIRSSLEIFEGDIDGRLVERNPFPASEDRCRSIRSDYYHSYRVDLPLSLQPGKHLLKLTVYDEFSGKSATEFIRFKVK